MLPIGPEKDLSFEAKAEVAAPQEHWARVLPPQEYKGLVLEEPPVEQAQDAEADAAIFAVALSEAEQTQRWSALHKRTVDLLVEALDIVAVVEAERDELRAALAGLPAEAERIGDALFQVWRDGVGRSYFHPSRMAEGVLDLKGQLLYRIGEYVRTHLDGAATTKEG